jgi:hypothetical protein
VLDASDLRTVLIAGVFADEMGNMGIGPLGHVTCEMEGGDESAISYLLSAIHVWHTFDEEVAGVHLDVVALVPELLEVWVMTYQSL